MDAKTLRTLRSVRQAEVGRELGADRELVHRPVVDRVRLDVLQHGRRVLLLLLLLALRRHDAAEQILRPERLELLDLRRRADVGDDRAAVLLQHGAQLLVDGEAHDVIFTIIIIVVVVVSVVVVGLF